MIYKIRPTILAALAFIIFATAPLLWQSINSTKLTEEALTQSNGLRFQELALNTIREIDQMLYARRQDLEQLAKATEMAEAETDDSQRVLSKVLQKWKEKYGIYSAILFVKDGGKVVAASSPEMIGRSVTNEAWYKSSSNSTVYSHALATSGSAISSAKIGSLQYDSLSGGYGINISIPIYLEQSKKRLGLLVSRLNWSEIAQVVNRVTITKNGQSNDSFALLLDEQGNVIAGPGFLLTKEQNSDEVIFSRNLVEQNWAAAKEAMAGNAGYLLQKDAGQLVGYASSKGYLDFTGLGWSTLVVENSSKTFAASKKIKTFAISILIGAVIIAILIALFFSKVLRQQISSLRTTLEALGKGYFAERTDLTGKSELASLGSTLNDAAQKIESLVKQEKCKKEAAESANRAKGEFLAEIGNGFRTPLSSIVEISEALLETNLSEDQRALARSMRKASCQLLALTNEVRDISRIETGQGTVEAKSFDLRNLVEEVAELLATTSHHLGIDVVVYYDSTAPHVLLGDPVRIHQVFTNLMSHALRNTQNKQMLVSVHAKDLGKESAVTIIVEDSGLGLDSERLSYLSQASSNGHGEEALDSFGDLATSKRLIELMGGRLTTVTTEQGTALALTLVLEKDMDAKQDSEVDLNKQTAVVATGSQIVDSVISKYLSEKGATCITTSPANLAKTLAKVNNGGVQLVTTNVLLSEGDFFEVAQSYSSKHQMGIVSLSTLNEQLSDSKKTSIPGLREIAKPLRKSELLRSMQSGNL